MTAPEPEDKLHPVYLLAYWCMVIRDAYDHDDPDHDLTVSEMSDYLERMLPRLSQDEHFDFPLLASELKRCRQHLEAVLHNDDRPDRGAPCPRCIEEGATRAPRLTRSWGHWCDDEDCARLHFADTTEDVWRCPANHDHAWGDEDYRLRVAEVYADTTKPVEATIAEQVADAVPSP